MYVNDILIPVTNDLNILRVHLNKQLNWSNHLNILKAKSKLRLNVISAISNQPWGANLNTIMRTYKSLILLVIDYRAIIYGAAPKSILQSLNSIHNPDIRLSISAFEISPIPSILYEANIFPLDIRRNILTQKFVIKILADRGKVISSYLLNPSLLSKRVKKKSVNRYKSKPITKHNETSTDDIPSYIIHRPTVDNGT